MELHVVIRNVLADHGRLSVDAETLDESADLHEAGLSSHATVAVMVAIEDAPGIEVPDYDDDILVTARRIRHDRVFAFP